MQIANKVSSRPYNTFNIDVDLRTLIHIEDKRDLDYIDVSEDDFLVLGGGSNVLLTSDIESKVLHIQTKGIEIIKEDASSILVCVAAGENWHDLVMWAVENGYGGIENLSLIPGKCGAAPMQNIGAYGVELKDVLHAVKAFDHNQKREFTFHNQECEFGYRTSNFKSKWKGRFVITDIILRLTKPSFHKINISYGDVSKLLESKLINEPSIGEISQAVIEIRQSKLPDPKEIGNSGSFFKNPIVSKSQVDHLLKSYSNMPFYPFEGSVKIPAGWLIDICGWRGRIVGNTGTYKNQALVLVNHGGATGQEILQLSKDIQSDVKLKFDIHLEPEVNIW